MPSKSNIVIDEEKNPADLNVYVLVDRKADDEEIKKRETIIKVALNHLTEKSYNLFSLNDVAKDVGIKKPSLFHHFKNKAELGYEALLYRYNRIKFLSAKLNELTANPQTKIDEFFKYFEHITLKRNCPFAVLSLEYSFLPPEIQQLVSEVITYVISFISAILQDGLDTKIFTFQEPASEKAKFIFSSIEGAVLLSRSSPSTNMFPSIINQIKSSLNP